jgi:hypothetical protein
MAESWIKAGLPLPRSAMPGAAYAAVSSLHWSINVKIKRIGNERPAFRK